jgi:c-di-AMP phosphodiesterase-like protein
MAGDIHHLQIRTNYRVREKIKKLALTHHRSTADIVRTSLELGLRLLEKLLEAQSEMVTEYIQLLKKESRLKSEKKT